MLTLKEFIRKLKNISDPEKKKIIGNLLKFSKDTLKELRVCF